MECVADFQYIREIMCCEDSIVTHLIEPWLAFCIYPELYLKDIIHLIISHLGCFGDFYFVNDV